VVSPSERGGIVGVVGIPVEGVEVDFEAGRAVVVPPVTTPQAPSTDTAIIKTTKAKRRFSMSIASIRSNIWVGQQGGLFQGLDVAAYLETAVDSPDLDTIEEAVRLILAAAPLYRDPSGAGHRFSFLGA